MSNFILPDFLNDFGFNRLRAQMDNAQLVNPIQERIISGGITFEEIRKLGNEGIDVDFEDIIILDDLTLSWKDRRVIVYIRDWTLAKHDSLPKFHVSNCKTLIDMREKKRYERYQISTRDDGIFRVNKINSAANQKIESDIKLKVCKNCLQALNWKNYKDSREKDAICDNFSLPEFYSVYPKDLIDKKPKYNSDTAPYNDYAPNQAELSANLKRNRNYRCDNCNLDLSTPQNHKYLHMHHMNGLKHDNNANNLQLLCVRCHAAMPLHAHMRNNPTYVEFERKFPDPNRLL